MKDAYRAFGLPLLLVGGGGVLVDVTTTLLFTSLFTALLLADVPTGCGAANDSF